MKISSGNSPAFGCGACRQIKTLTAKQVGPENADLYYKGLQQVVKAYQQKAQVKHGSAAIRVLKVLRTVFGIK